MATDENGLKLRNFLEAAAKELSDYEIGFAKLREDGISKDAYLSGSGILVVFDRVHAILTAHHVLENLPDEGELGVILPTRFEAQLHRATLRMELARKICVGRGVDEARGPDLGILVLNEEDAGRLKATKSFYNLSRRRERMLSTALTIDAGAWFLSGMAEEWTTDGPPEKGYEKVKIFRGITGAGIVTSEECDEYFDYLIFETRYDDAYEGPQNYEGFSGGGLWQVFAVDQGDGFSTRERFLSGVAFYQSALEGNVRTIRCHGRRSLYEASFDAISTIVS